MSSVPLKRFTEEEYLAREEVAEIRSEYYRGEIFAMSGGSPRHARIIANLSRAVGTRLLSGNCAEYSSELRIKVRSVGLITYPDLSVICGEVQVDERDKHAAINPTALFEVLSPTTELYDRTDKFRFYRGLDSLQHVVLVSQEKALVEVHSRGAGDVWSLVESIGLDESFHLAKVGITVPLMELYLGVTLDPPDQPSDHPRSG